MHIKPSKVIYAKRLRNHWKQDVVERTAPCERVPGLRLSSPGEWERHTAMSGGAGRSICCSLCSVSTPSHTRPFQLKWEVYFSKRLCCSSLLLCRYDSFCINLHMSIQQYASSKVNRALTFIFGLISKRNEMKWTLISNTHPPRYGLILTKLFC